MDPFLPWPGSKAKCAAEIITEFPLHFERYFEPFLGSGAVYWNMQTDKGLLKREVKEAILSDVNQKLIRCWREVRDNVDEMSLKLRAHFAANTERYYYSKRKLVGDPDVFLYLMRAGFSSMYRENKAGEFNVPWRKKDFEAGRTISYDVDYLKACSEQLAKNAHLLSGPWHEASMFADAGDLVYFDPPYLPYNATGFVGYSSEGFGLGEHVVLANRCRELAKRGVFVALSNSDTEDSRRIYGDPHKTINVTNSVRAKALKKGSRPEGLWLFKP